MANKITICWVCERPVTAYGAEFCEVHGPQFLKWMRSYVLKYKNIRYFVKKFLALKKEGKL